LRLQYDETLSNFAFNFNMRRYTMEDLYAYGINVDVSATGLVGRFDFLFFAQTIIGRGLHSFPSLLNLSRF